MSYYNKIKKLDEESLERLKEGTGPIDQCICSILSPPEDETRLGAVKTSIKRAFGSISGGRNKKKEERRDPGGKKKFENMAGNRSIDIPLVYNKGKQGVYTTKEAVKRGSCGKCGCDKSNVVLKHSYANIRITSPDVSSICPCPTDCLPNRAKLQDNITVTIERVEVRGALKFEEKSQSIPEESRQESVNEEVRQLGDSLAGSETLIYSNDVEKL